MVEQEPDHLFWLRRWMESRRLVRRIGHGGQIAAMNQMLYLTEVFSWYMDNWKIHVIKERP